MFLPNTYESKQEVLGIAQYEYIAFLRYIYTFEILAYKNDWNHIPYTIILCDFDSSYIPLTIYGGILI